MLSRDGLTPPTSYLISKSPLKYAGVSPNIPQRGVGTLRVSYRSVQDSGSGFLIAGPLDPCGPDPITVPGKSGPLLPAPPAPSQV